MNIWHKLFGKWEVQSERFVVAEYSSTFKCLRGEREELLVIEKHSKSGKERAYIKDIFGNKTQIDMNYVRNIK